MTMILPKGFLPLREVIVSVAEHLQPDVDLRAYLAPPNPGDSLLEAVRALSPKIQAAFVTDPFEWPRTDADWIAPGWLALEASRAKLGQAFVDGDLVGYDENRGEDEPLPLRRAFWRGQSGYNALRLGRVDGRHPTIHWQKVTSAILLVRAAQVESWLEGRRVRRDRAGKPAQEIVEAWMRSYTLPAPGKQQVKRADTIQTCMKETGATDRMAKRAWMSLPPKIRRERGRPKSDE